ncbi:EpsI family protein [Leptolyngbya sp. 15MV]|nr:EpsI family protein [Leptolyngbya sp. 15MV]
MTEPISRVGDTRLDRRKVLIGLAMAAASATAFARAPEPNRPRIKKTDFEALMPDTVGPWQFATSSGVILPPPDALSDRLYDNLVTRVYTDASRRPIMFLIAYNNRQDGMLQIHRPEICYPAGGFRLSPTRPADVQLASGQVLPTNAFVATARDREEAVMYFTRVGSDFPQRWSEQRLAVIGANLRGVIPDGLLLRVSTFGRDTASDLAVLEDFITQFVEASPDRLRAIILGTMA